MSKAKTAVPGECLNNVHNRCWDISLIFLRHPFFTGAILK